MNKRPLWALLVVALAVVGVVLFRLPSDTSASTPTAEGSARLVPSGGTVAPDDSSGVTNPAEPQPELKIDKLAPGEQPPQFVVVSFDGGVENKTGIMKHYLDVAKQIDGRFSFNISGVYLLPDNKMKLNYNPPRHPRGTSAIGFGDPSIIGERINVLADAWRDGHEMASHFNGHFCGAGGVGAWNTADWNSEISQFNTFLDDWRSFNPQAADAGPLPFSSADIKGDRTPCLEGNRPAMYKAFLKAGYLYDGSGSGPLAWPRQLKDGLWNIPLESIKVNGFKTPILSMDYNFLANQVPGGATTGTQAKCDQVQNDTYDAYRDAFNAVYNGNRAPLILGNHMNEWMCGAYKNALSNFLTDTHDKHPDVQFISMLDLVHWMQAQDPAVIAALQARPAQRQ